MPTPSASTSIARDQRGAVLVLAIFAVMFLAGTLFFLAGNGEAIEHRGQGQGAADAAAFSGAVVQATAMNDLALLNMSKLGGTVVLTHYGSALAGAAAGAAAASAACPFWKAACRWAKQLWRKTSQLGRDLGKAARGVVPGLVAASRSQEALTRLSPIYADARMEEVARGFPGVHGAFLAPALVLPVEPEDAGTWCGRLSGRLPAMLAITFSDGTSPFHLMAYGVAVGSVDRVCRGLGHRGVRPVDGATLGSDYYQVQAYTLQDAVSGAADRNLARTATWGRTETGGGINRRRVIASQLHTAQAEYYLEGNAPRDQLLWSMRWKARLTRFRLLDDLRLFRATCATRWPTAPCDDFTTTVRELAPFFRH